MTYEELISRPVDLLEGLAAIYNHEGYVLWSKYKDDSRMSEQAYKSRLAETIWNAMPDYAKTKS